MPRVRRPRSPRNLDRVLATLERVLMRHLPCNPKKKKKKNITSFVLPAAASSMLTSHKASWCKLSRSAQLQSVLCPASASSQGSKQSSIWGSAWGTTCRQLVIRPSQASIMPSRLRSVTGQLAACPSWAGCMWPSRCWQLLCGIMPRFRGHQSSCSIRSAASSATMWQQHSKAATATISALPGISFITGQQTVKHLGVRLGYDMQAACHQTFTSIYHAIKAKASH